MKVWLRASRKEGLRVPWAFIRSQLAQRFHTTPLAIDAWPANEVQEALRLLTLEAEAAAWHARQAPLGPRGGRR